MVGDRLILLSSEPADSAVRAVFIADAAGPCKLVVNLDEIVVLLHVCQFSDMCVPVLA